MSGTIKKVAVVGAGTMGHGIAEVCAIHGYEVVLIDVSNDILRGALEKIKWSLDELTKKGLVKEPIDAVLNRIKPTTFYEQARDVDLVIEAVVENTAIKKEVFKRLSEVVKADAVFTTNTSTIPISELANATNRPEKFVGLHFVNPPVLIHFVEVIRGDKTSDESVATVVDFAKSIGFKYVVLKRDVPGFLINRLNARHWIEALRMFEEGLDVRDIDAAQRFRLGFPMGPFELLDFSGIDVGYLALNEMVRRGFNIKLPEVLKKMYEENRWGMKTGMGFYKYPRSGAYVRPTILPSDKMYDLNPYRMIASVVNEAVWLLRNEIVTRDEVELAMKEAMQWPIGPLTWADRIGVDNVVSMLKERFEETGLDEYRPDPLLEEMVKEGKLGLKSGEGFFKWKYEKRDLGAVIYEKRHDHAVITINRPDKLNALNEAVWEGLRVALEEAEKDPDVRVAILTGSGRAFSAGDDIAMMSKWKTSMDAKVWNDKYATPLIEKMIEFKKPLITLVNGLAFGGGMELNILADIVIASKETVFAIPETLIGAFPPLASSCGAPLVSKKIIRYALTGEWLSADQAKELGLVDIVVPPDQLEATAAEIVMKILRAAPLGVEAVKSSVRAYRRTCKELMRAAVQELVILSSSHDFIEGAKAFIEKRAPTWKGE
ncbi:MAG: 3-hydroxyacyl-CoA dehydrogenase/enoyl-CoA hydratase family protein [Sulfolobales archaeon]|nr:3-hydroxyacyl-CoA dehydrogenase/enoyl-CoA hydratase family protein [Sulfolobales archaeon]